MREEGAEAVSRVWMVMSMIEGCLEIASMRQLHFIISEVGYIRALSGMCGKG